MKGFQITRAQISAIACGLAADVLARDFNRYIDFTSQAALSPHTKFMDDPLSLDEDEIAACRHCLCGYFGHSTDVLSLSENSCFDDWAGYLHDAVSQRLVSFDFGGGNFGVEQRDDSDRRIYRADALFQDARVVASLLHGRRRVLTFVSAHSLFGLVLTVMAPNLQGIEVIDGRGVNPDELAEALSFGDMIVATPTVWQYLTQALPAFPSNIVGISFGGTLTLPLALQLREMGLGAMRELYGSTGTGLIAWRDAPTEQFVLFDHWHRTGDEIIRVMPDESEMPVSPVDYLDWQSERGFTPGGRRDGAVRVGVSSVFPEKIAKIITGHPEIGQCRIRIVHHEQGLSKLIAHIQLEKGITPDQRMAWKVDAWCRAHLSPPERPRIYQFEEAMDGAGRKTCV